MKFKGLLILGLFLVFQVNSQEVIRFQDFSQSSDLVCPPIKKTGFKLYQNASNTEDINSLPDDETLESIKKAYQGNVNQLPVEFTSHQNSGPYKIGIWGDSHAAANFMTEELIRFIGLDADQALPTFIPPSMGRPGVRLPIRKFCQSPTWQMNYAFTGVNNEHYGPALLKLNTNIPDSYLWIDFRSKNNNMNQLKQLNILFSKTKKGSAKLGIQIDGRPEKMIEINNSLASYLSIQGDSLFGVIKIRLIEGGVSIDGFVPIYDIKAQVYVDTFGIPGATIKGWQGIQKSYIDSLKAPTDYDLIILEYGTNEGSHLPFNSTLYQQLLRESLLNFRSIYPSSSCLLMGPTDRGIWHKKTYTKGKKKLIKAEPMPDFLMYSKIHQEITQIQKDVGQDFACSSWSWQEAMGGPGGAYTWIKHTPPLMAKDLIHLTVQGYQETARKLGSDIKLPALIHLKEPE